MSRLGSELQQQAATIVREMFDGRAEMLRQVVAILERHPCISSAIRFRN